MKKLFFFTEYVKRNLLDFSYEKSNSSLPFYILFIDKYL